MSDPARAGSELNGHEIGMASRLVCAGCGASPPADEPYPFRCPDHGVGDVDHVLERILDPARVTFPSASGPGGPGGPGGSSDRGEAGTFSRYRGLLHSYHRARAGGIGDEELSVIVETLDAKVAAVDGRGFGETPLRRDPVISERLGFSTEGGVWVKDETGNVAGSHKARHLMGVLLHLEVAELLGLVDPAERPDLAIASCGNAALAAAVIAAAGGRHLRVFVPADADAHITGRLAALGAEVIGCERRPGEAGDPTYLRLLEALQSGALPFTCQGNLNGLAIEGGETLGYEMVSALRESGVELDHLVVQVGGGALASSCAQAFAEAAELGACERLPRLHTVQTTGAHPLERAWRRVVAHLPDAPTGEEIEAAVHEAATRRSGYMWPWESEPHSLAGGILDDETYDWVQVVRAMLRTGGQPLVTSEERLAAANELGKEAGYPVDPTGSSGLAGLVDLVAQGVVGPTERVGVLFTGVDRAEEATSRGG